jgi:hypothetical protein
MDAGDARGHPGHKEYRIHEIAAEGQMAPPEEFVRCL